MNRHNILCNYPLFYIKMQVKKATILINEISDFMQKNNLKQTELSNLLSISQSSISRLFTDPPKKPTRTIKSICNYANIDIYSYEEVHPENSEILMKVLKENWDGTKTHAKKIAKIIKAAC